MWIWCSSGGAPQPETTGGSQPGDSAAVLVTCWHRVSEAISAGPLAAPVLGAVPEWGHHVVQHIGEPTVAAPLAASLHFITIWSRKTEIPVVSYLAPSSQLSPRGLCLMLLWEIEFESLEVTSISSSGIMVIHLGVVAMVIWVRDSAFCWWSRWKAKSTGVGSLVCTFSSSLRSNLEALARTAEMLRN